MKLNYIIVLGFLIAFSISDYDSCALILNPTSKKDCNDKLTDWDKQNNYKYCCYQEIAGEKDCVPYNQVSYDALGKAKTNVAGWKIECNSSYLKLGLLSLLFFIF